MPILNWGDLTKNSEDSETIEQAIARIIAQHNADQESHLAEGQSLQSHKASMIIDHLAESIINDKILDGEIDNKKLSNRELSINTCFESLDGWSKSASGVIPGIGGANIQTSTTINTVKILTGGQMGASAGVEFNKEMMMQEIVECGHNTNQIIYFGMGQLELDGSDSFFGFKIINATVYACMITGDGNTSTEYTQALTNITITQNNAYRALFSPETSDIKFYVNDNLKHTYSANLPYYNNPVLYSHYVKNTTAANKMVIFRNLLISKKV